MNRRFPFYPENVPSELKHRRQFVNWKAIEKPDGRLDKIPHTPRIVYIPRPDATPEAELKALAVVYRFILVDCHAKKMAARPGDPDDHKRFVNKSEGG
jgi:hypothetical protein